MPMREHIIAVVDDGVRKSLARLLSAFGYRVEPFASAEKFLNAAPTSKATCLVVDFNLGDVSGLEVRRRGPTSAGRVPRIRDACRDRPTSPDRLRLRPTLDIGGCGLRSSCEETHRRENLSTQSVPWLAPPEMTRQVHALSG